VSGALSRLAREVGLTEKLVNGGFDEVMTRFTAEVQCRELMRVYRDVCDEPIALTRRATEIQGGWGG